MLSHMSQTDTQLDGQRDYRLAPVVKLERSCSSIVQNWTRWSGRIYNALRIPNETSQSSCLLIMNMSKETSAGRRRGGKLTSKKQTNK